MLNQVIEKYFKDIEDKPVWEFLGISQVTWSNYKKNGVPEKHLYSIVIDHLSLWDKDYPVIEYELTKRITDLYYLKK